MIAVATAGVMTMAGVAAADQLQADADSLASGNGQHGNSIDAPQAEGTTVEYDLSGVINDTGNSNDNVFANLGDSVTVNIARSGDWLALSPGTPDFWTFSSYGVNKTGKIRVTVPACTAPGTSKTMTALVTVGTVSKQERMSNTSFTLSYTITDTAGT